MLRYTGRMAKLRQLISRAAVSRTWASIALTALNLAICWRLFNTEYIDQFRSNEGSAIAIARYISEHWGQFSWWPLWHCGMPYQDTYVPLLHLVVAVLASLGHISAARAYHAVVGVAYAFGPATLYLMASRLGAPPGSSFLAGLSYSLISPSAILIPNFAGDIGGIWYNRRLQVLTAYGEGPHISAITLIPLAILALESALTRRTGRAFALPAIVMTLIFLTNVPGSMALGLAVFCWICAQPRGRRARAWLYAAMSAALGYCLACYGVPPTAVATVLRTTGPMHSGFSAVLHHQPWVVAVVLGAAAGLGSLLSRTRLPVVLRFAILNSSLLAVMIFTANPQRFEMLPQIRRLHLEMEMGICLLLGAAVWALYRWLPNRLRPALAVMLVAITVVQYRHYKFQARGLIRNADLPAHSEYTTARWLDAHMNGARVYVTGSTSFWLNAFTDTPQLVGCCDQGESMRVLNDLVFGVNSNTTNLQTEMSTTWLQAMGVHALVVNGPGSTDPYKDIKVPARFASMLPVLHEEHGDTIYEIPGPPSLAHIVHAGEAVPVSSLSQVSFSNVQRYAGALIDDSRPGASFEWLRGGTARIRALLRTDDLVSVQVAWFPGWKAYIGTRSIPVSADGLGFLLLKPGCQGPCEISLLWKGRPDQTFAAAVSLLALAGIGILIILDPSLGPGAAPSRPYQVPKSQPPLKNGNLGAKMLSVASADEA